jgi:hypothetical protein
MSYWRAALIYVALIVESISALSSHSLYACSTASTAAARPQLFSPASAFGPSRLPIPGSVTGAGSSSLVNSRLITSNSHPDRPRSQLTSHTTYDSTSTTHPPSLPLPPSVLHTPPHRHFLYNHDQAPDVPRCIRRIDSISSVRPLHFTSLQLSSLNHTPGASLHRRVIPATCSQNVSRRPSRISARTANYANWVPSPRWSWAISDRVTDLSLQQMPHASYNSLM